MATQLTIRLNSHLTPQLPPLSTPTPITIRTRTRPRDLTAMPHGMPTRISTVRAVVDAQHPGAGRLAVARAALQAASRIC